MYADDLVLYGKLEEDLKVMVGHFVKVCRKKCMKFNTDMSKVMALDGEERFKCVICVDGTQLEQVSKLKCVENVLDE